MKNDPPQNGDFELEIVGLEKLDLEALKGKGNMVETSIVASNDATLFANRALPPGEWQFVEKIKREDGTEDWIVWSPERGISYRLVNVYMTGYDVKAVDGEEMKMNCEVDMNITYDSWEEK